MSNMFVTVREQPWYVCNVKYVRKIYSFATYEIDVTNRNYLILALYRVLSDTSTTFVCIAFA